MMNRQRGVVLVGGLIVLVASFFMLPNAQAEELVSPSYKLNGNLGGSFGGQVSGGSYQMHAIGGETVVGNGAGGSYIIDQVQESSSASISLSVLPGGVVGYYPLDENTGTTSADASRYSNNGTLNSTAAWNASGKLASGVDINGSTDSLGTGAVLVGDNSDLPSGSAFTVEAWVNQDAWYANQAIASHWQYSTSGAWAIQTGANNSLRVYIADSATDTGINYFESVTNSWNNFNSWHHVAVTYDGTASTQADRIKVYVDGSSVSGSLTGTIPSSLQNSSASLSLGSWPGRGRALSGSLDHVKIFNRALSSAEVNAEYTAQNGGTSSGISFGALTGSPQTTLVDAIVRTDATSYSVTVQQNGNLTSGGNTINAIGGTIASPAAWSDGTTKGLGFTILSAPTLEGKWGSGANYAAFPGSATTFYPGTGPGSTVTDILGMRYKIDITGTQTAGAYSNAVTYTATVTP